MSSQFTWKSKSFDASGGGEGGSSNNCSIQVSQWRVPWAHCSRHHEVHVDDASLVIDMCRIIIGINIISNMNINIIIIINININLIIIIIINIIITTTSQLRGAAVKCTHVSNTKLVCRWLASSEIVIMVRSCADPGFVGRHGPLKPQIDHLCVFVCLCTYPLNHDVRGGGGGACISINNNTTNINISNNNNCNDININIGNNINTNNNTAHVDDQRRIINMNLMVSRTMCPRHSPL